MQIFITAVISPNAGRQDEGFIINFTILHKVGLSRKFTFIKIVYFGYAA
jgi:hypothetical protein